MKEHTYNLPDGFTVRPPTFDDLQADVDLLNAYFVDLTGKPRFEAADIESEWKSPYSNREKNVRFVFAPDGRLVADVGIWAEPPYVRLFGWMFIHPEYKGLDLAHYLTEWIATRGREIMLSAPEGTRVVVRQDYLQQVEHIHDLLLEHNYDLIRHMFRMQIDMDSPPPEPRFPEGIVIRTFDRATQMHALVQAERDIFQDHWGFVEKSYEEDYKSWVHWTDNDEHFDPSLWFLALDGDRIAGVSLCTGFRVEDPEMGYVKSLGVQRDWRRKGIGLALLHHSFGELYRRGKKRVTLHVDAMSLTGATLLYEKSGMHVAERSDVFELVLRDGEDISTQTLEA
ncbi:MAG: GNAT family N-acetyltransferase [Anaerolineae bacterium]|nr:GNAT family N-acetyltransferase [Anaerolineae bacterium]